MNKKISIPIVPILIAIIAVVIIIVLLTRGTEEQMSKLNNVYDKMVLNQTYAFTRHNFEEKNKKTVYRKSDKTLIDRYELGEHISSTLILDGDTYLIAHKDKEYYVYLNNNSDEDTLTNALNEMIDSESTTGKEKIYGKTYKYEEYEGGSYFLFPTEDNIDVSSIKTRFYFKGKDLVYLKTIYNVVNEETGEKEQKEELQTVKVEYKVEDEIFEIPSDYAEN